MNYSIFIKSLKYLFIFGRLGCDIFRGITRVAGKAVAHLAFVQRFCLFAHTLCVVVGVRWYFFFGWVGPLGFASPAHSFASDLVGWRTAMVQVRSEKRDHFRMAFFGGAGCPLARSRCRQRCRHNQQTIGSQVRDYDLINCELFLFFLLDFGQSALKEPHVLTRTCAAVLLVRLAPPVPRASPWYAGGL